MASNFKKIQEALGDKADNLLSHSSKTVLKDALHLPSPNWLDQIHGISNRSNPKVTRKLDPATILAKTGYPIPAKEVERTLEIA